MIKADANFSGSFAVSTILVDYAYTVDLHDRVARFVLDRRSAARIHMCAAARACHADDVMVTLHS